MPRLMVPSLPLSARSALEGSLSPDCDSSTESTIAARHNAVKKRDRFLGKAGCVVCGEQDPYGLVETLIVPGTEEGTRRWQELRRMGALPTQAQPQPEFDPHNGVIMCVNHDVLFKLHAFYIHFDLPNGKFVLINVDSPSLDIFHGKAVGIDIHDQDAPYPLLFNVQEIQGREDNPLKFPTTPSILGKIEWQDWLLSKGVVDLDTSSLRRARPRSNDILEVLSGFATDDDGETSGGAAADPMDDLLDPDDYTDEELLVMRDRISACLASRQGPKSPVGPPPAPAERTRSASKPSSGDLILASSAPTYNFHQLRSGKRSYGDSEEEAVAPGPSARNDASRKKHRQRS
ncbi:hypothetical protein LXA43DRAFT_1022301 [Ganoderma leucocontextum]|nr:hypothetical protein LXA43DRAFT_1022301 [Ganoderma leucocontextum]